jgi:tetratricopeptide (TPR) repeat protein
MKSALTTTLVAAAAFFLSNCATQNTYVIEDVLDARAVSNYGLDLFAAGDLKAAVTAFNAVIDYGSIDYRDYARRAAAYGAMEKYDVALKDTEQALKLSPRQWRTHLQRAVIHQRTFKFDNAISDLDSALEINSGEIELLRRRAYLKMLAGRYNGAIDDYDALARKRPQSNTGALGRGVALYLAGEWSSAAKAFTNVLESSPGDGLAVLWLAKSILRAPGGPISWEEFAADAGPEREWAMANLLIATTDRDMVEDAMHDLFDPETTTYLDECEHVLFLGTWRLIKDKGDGAKRAFETANQTCPVDSIEGAEARAELERLGRG